AHFPTEEARKILCILLAQTLQKDSIIWRSEEFEAQAILERIQAQLEELYALNEMLLVIRVEIVIWKPLENAFIKINFDGGVSSPFLEIMFEDYVAIKVDYLMVIKKLQANMKDDSCISAYISNLNSLQKKFKNCVFLHIQRQRNQRRWWRMIDGERLGGVPLDCEMKIRFKVLLGYSLIMENSSEG
ncbi:hypothetical protein Goshw_002932, partial [Gossypium schwendimanii]|nr:hypothetical protein [Gossypium schwendimanii]